MTTPLYPLSKKHYLAFGVIVHSFARFERLIEIAIHTAIDARSFGLTAMTVSGLGYQAKSDLLAALLETVKFPHDHNEVVAEILSDFNAHLNLRNLIAHHVWREGKRPGSIKVVKVSTRGGKRRLQGVRDNDADYTEDELIAIADSLNAQCGEFAAFMEAAGIFSSIDKKTSRARAS